ncbi:hypothetical protein [Paracidobacterium acidisoli]|uniref:hypothetical protein n=1 Tax=Paracidobacterium acidisoli TaxID=2303751 RepID=UPI0011C16EE7|nr:hypothetical protein [Paracidobacterium acidisoli]MBT9332951.1 hypothetical protein [Paracidobacterium acidisoli]
MIDDGGGEISGASVLIAHPLHPQVTEPSGIGIDEQVLGPPELAGVQSLGSAGSHIRYIVAWKESLNSQPRHLQVRATMQTFTSDIQSTRLKKTAQLTEG